MGAQLPFPARALQPGGAQLYTDQRGYDVLIGKLAFARGKIEQRKLD